MLFAKVETDNTVSNVLVVDKGTEKKSLDWLKKSLGGSWVRTYSVFHVENGSDQARRGLSAGIGMIYDSEKDIFHQPQPYPSWSLDMQTFVWVAPVSLDIAEGEDASEYEWHEELGDWQKVSLDG